MFFVFPNDARWNDACQAVEFGIGIGEYESVVLSAVDQWQSYAGAPL